MRAVEVYRSGKRLAVLQKLTDSSRPFAYPEPCQACRCCAQASPKAGHQAGAETRAQTGASAQAGAYAKPAAFASASSFSAISQPHTCTSRLAAAVCLASPAVSLATGPAALAACPSALAAARFAAAGTARSDARSGCTTGVGATRQRGAV